MSDETDTAGDSARLTARIDRLTEARRQAEAEVEQLRGKVRTLEEEAVTLRAGQAEAGGHKARVDELAATLDTERRGWATERAILAAGITDPEGVDVVRWAYERTNAPEGGERPPLADWLGARDALPRAVQAYLPAPAAGGVTPSPQVAPAVGAPVSRGVGPNPDRGAAVGAPTTPQFTAESVARMTPEQWKVSRAAVLGSLGGGRINGA